MAWAQDPRNVELVDVVDCEVELSLRVYNLKIRAGNQNLAVQIPELFNTPVSTVTHSFDMILKGLGMDQAEFKSTFKGKKVLLVGEGFGELLPNLKAAGAEIKAIDPLYALANVDEDLWTLDVLEGRPKALQTVQHVKQYLSEHEDVIVPGLSTALPFASESFDFVISHFLLNNFITKSKDPSDQQEVRRLNQLTVLESARVLRPGGRAIHVLRGDDDRKRKYLEHILSSTELATVKPLQIQFKIDGPISLPIDYRYPQDLDHADVNAWRLIVTRK